MCWDADRDNGAGGAGGRWSGGGALMFIGFAPVRGVRSRLARIRRAGCAPRQCDTRKCPYMGMAC